MKKAVREWIITIGLAVVIYLLILAVVQDSEVFDISMQPTLVEGQRLVVVKVLYTFTDPQRGDIITVYPPINSEKQFVKRLIGLPGDTIEIRSGTVYVNDVPLDEPYIKEKPRYTFGPFTVPEDNYFVLGDNRNNSTDSHYGWTVTRDEIVGKACLRFWPFSKFGNPGNYPLNEQVESATPAAAASANWNQPPRLSYNDAGIEVLFNRVGKVSP